MGYILLVNDDGADSPALLPLGRALARIAQVRIVVPDRERSWISKAITRWEEIRVRTITREGVELTLVGGFPADCTNLGVHSLFESPPDMVVSGVNIGLNSGLGFFLSSGTVGAAMEGWIAGLPALAFSVGGTPGEDRDWKSRIGTEEFADLWPRAAALSADIVATVRSSGFPRGVDLINVNFPLRADVHTQRLITGLGKIGYDDLFRHKGDGLYTHDFSGAFRASEALDGTDVAALREGSVSITPVRLAHAATLDPELARRLLRPLA